MSPPNEPCLHGLAGRQRGAEGCQERPETHAGGVEEPGAGELLPHEERDGGLYLQLEAVSLTRSIPRGFGWAVRPYIESIPRESLEFTLRSVCNVLHK